MADSDFPAGTAYAVNYGAVDTSAPGIPVKAYYSYAAFQADGPQPVDWVMYDTEHQTSTPKAEQNDPITCMNEFGKLAHKRFYHVINAPARDLSYAPAPVCPRHADPVDRWYVSACGTGLPGGAAGNTDIWLCQSEVDETSVSAYQTLVGDSRTDIAVSTNPGCLLYAELSTGNGTASQMIAAARSVTVDGFYLAIPDGDISKAVQVIEAISG
jgi:hypothetical protein